MKLKIDCTINGKKQTLEAHPMTRLLDCLRENLELTGTKEGCGEGECGACSVLVDGELVNSCLVPVIQVQGTKVTTIEGVSASKTAKALQKNFVACGGAQCGICTPGMILASVNLLNKNKKPSQAQIAEALAGNICRCTGYTKIFDSVARAGKELR